MFDAICRKAELSLRQAAGGSFWFLVARGPRAGDVVRGLGRGVLGGHIGTTGCSQANRRVRLDYDRPVCDISAEDPYTWMNVTHDQVCETLPSRLAPPLAALVTENAGSPSSS